MASKAQRIAAFVADTSPENHRDGCAWAYAPGNYGLTAEDVIPALIATGRFKTVTPEWGGIYVNMVPDPRWRDPIDLVANAL